jgi:C-terminal processing protease CtpA/Prc
VIVRTIAAAIGGLVLAIAVVTAQAPSPALEPAAINAAVQQVTTVFANEYFDIPLSTKVAAEINARAAAGRYSDAVKAPDLAKRLTADFYELTKDKHVSVAVARREGGTAQSGPERRNVPTTAGFRRTEILPGNIGLLDMAFFMRPVEHRDALAAAMQTLEPADALILDMRENSGGSPGTVALLVSYLLDPPERSLFEIVTRRGTRETYSTEPVPTRNSRRPVYVLTSRRSFSGGEGLAFLLQDLKRAVVIGEVTAGAANAGRPYPAGDLFDITVPNAQLLTSVTKRNWEGPGVTPDVRMPAADALRVAQLRAIDDLIAASASETRRAELQRVRSALIQR